MDMKAPFLKSKTPEGAGHHHHGVRRATTKVKVDASTTYQEIVGFGGAFTEAAALNFAKLPKDVQDKVSFHA
jgi:O-glycosyl hydrolase